MKVAALAHPCARGISASMHVIACIEDPRVIRQILEYLDRRADPVQSSPHGRYAAPGIGVGAFAFTVR